MIKNGESKEKALSHCRTINCYELKFIEETIDETLKEFIKLLANIRTPAAVVYIWRNYEMELL